MITLLKGDSATSRFGRQLRFTITTSLDTTGCSVRFSMNGIVADAQFDGTDAVVELSAEQTSLLRFGVGFASIALVAGANICTIKNDLAVKVTDCISEVEDASNSATIEITNAWQKALEGVNWNAGGSIGSLRDFLARVGAALGASVVAR